MKKVLLVSLENLGDLVFVSAMARILSQDPEVELSLWCKDYTSGIGHLLPGVRRVYAADPFWDKAPKRSRGRWRHFMRSWRSIRRAKFDVALIVMTCWRTALFVKLAGIPERWGIEGRRNRPLLTRVLPRPPRDRGVVLGFLEAFAPVLPLLREPAAEAFTSLDQSRLPRLELPAKLASKKLAVLHPFAGRIDRCAPLAYWERIAALLSAEGYFVIWTGIASELAQLRETWPDWPAEHYIDTWAKDLPSLAWLWSRAALFVGHDSGPLHVSHALGVPVVGLYLPGEFLRTFPQAQAPSLMIQAASPAALALATLEAELMKFVRGLPPLPDPAVEVASRTSETAGARRD